MQYLDAVAEMAPEIERRKLVERDNAFAARMLDAINDGSECAIPEYEPPTPGIIRPRDELYAPSIDNGPGRPVVLKPDGADAQLTAEKAAAETSAHVTAALESIRMHEGRRRPRFGYFDFLDLEAGECRWPIGDEDFTFCGAPVCHGSYCMKHHRISYRKGRG